MGGANGFSSVDDSRDSGRRSIRTIRTRDDEVGGGRGGGGADGHGVMLVTLASANFGTAKISHSTFRGKLGRLLTRPIGLNYD